MGSPTKGGGGSAPQQPSPQFIAGQQTNSNIQTAAANSYLNAINQYTPYGNVKWNQVGSRQMGDGTVSIPEWQVTTEYTPQQQQILDAQRAVTLGTAELARDYTGRIRDSTATPFSMGGMPQTGPMPVYNDAYRNQVRDTILQRNAPQLEQDRARFEQRLADQGIGMEDPAYRTGWSQFDRGVNDFRLGADLAAQQQATADFGNQVQGYGLTVDARNRAIQEELMRRNQPINEVAALLGTGPGVQMPQFQNTHQQPIAPTDVSGAYANDYAGRLAQYQMQNAGSNAMMGGLFGLGGAIGGGLARNPGLFGMGGGGASMMGGADMAQSGMQFKEGGMVPKRRQHFAWGGMAAPDVRPISMGAGQQAFDPYDPGASLWGQFDPDNPEFEDDPGEGIGRGAGGFAGGLIGRMWGPIGAMAGREIGQKVGGGVGAAVQGKWNEVGENLVEGTPFDFVFNNGGAVPGGNANMVPPSASPSGGAQTDDVTAQISVGEFVVPEDVTAWYGEKFMQEMIEAARKQMANRTAAPEMKPAKATLPTFRSEGARR